MTNSEATRKPAVVLVPHAGGDGLSYGRMIKRLSEDGDVFFYEMAGHGKRAGEDFYGSYGEVLSDLVSFIREKTADCGPYLLCGVSMGAFLCDNAYERLEKEGDRLPGHVIYAAVDPARSASEYDIRQVEEKSSNLELLTLDNSYSQYLKTILEKDLELMIKGKAGFKARLKCPLSHFMGKEDSLLGRSVYDWSAYAAMGAREYLFDGPHLFMTSNDNVINTIIRIRDSLQER
ncbi:MAG: alpha/beta hydrolase [Butyrivibrio sp.]|nr:alpha/beta hydrolase [Butyrivibrio sp.]